MERDRGNENESPDTQRDGLDLDSVASAAMTHGFKARKYEQVAADRFMSDIVRRTDVSMEEIQLIQASGVYLNAFKKIIRYNDTEWDVDRQEDELDVLLDKVRESEEYRSPRPAVMLPSAVLDIRATSAKAMPAMERLDVAEKYATFKNELSSVAISAGNRFSNPEALTVILSDLRGEVAIMFEQCSVDIATNQHEDQRSVEYRNKVALLQDLGEAITFLDACISRETIDVRAYAEMFPSLSRHKKLYSSLRKLAFALTFQRRLPLQSMFTKLPDEPNLNAIEQIDYFVNREVVGNIFKDVFEQDHVTRKFKRMCKTGPIEKGKYGGQVATDETRKIQFTPTQGVLREFSAYIGDSCYTPQGELAAEKHPNVTAIIMKQINRGTGEERFVGSSLLIDTTDSDGKKVAVIRALNPIENIINKLSVSDFYHQFISYVKEAIGDEYSKVGIVIDNRAGGAATNRPLLFNYLKELREQGVLKPMPVNKEDTTINNFDISEKVYQV